MTYPQYKKYQNNRVYFKILSPSEWEELHVSKAGVTLHSFTAKILPDRNYLEDMIANYGAHWVISDETEYEKLKSQLRN